MNNWISAVFALLAASGTMLSAQEARAMVIKPIFDNSITNSTYASVIETAFNAVAGDFGTALSSQVTINVAVSWGSVGGYALPSSAVGASVDTLYGYYTYSKVKSLLTTASISNPNDLALNKAVSSLPLNAPTGAALYAVASAEAKVLGIIPANTSGVDGSIGFAGSPTGFSFNPAAGIAAGTYDFQAVAAHELEEVLGRISGVRVTGSATYRTPFDLFRYSAGALTTSATDLSYFSIDGGKTSIGYFNNSIYGGDRGDWLTPGVTNSAADAKYAVANDIQDAFISPGQKGRNLTAADLAALDALGYGGSNIGNSVTPNPLAVAFNLVDPTGVPEPAPGLMLLSALAVFGFARRRPAV